MQASITMKTNPGRLFLGLLATAVMIIGFLVASPPTVAQAASGQTFTMPDGTVVNTADFTQADFDAAIQGLIASDVPRTKSGSAGSAVITFHIAVDPLAVPGGVFDLTVADTSVPRVQPLLGGGVDSGGVYILLNNFDQNVVLGGATTAIGAALCAIPAIGWVGCAAILSALVVITVWLSVNGLCPQNLKWYVVPNRPAGCVRY